MLELWCWRRLLRVPLDSKEIKPVNPKGNQPWIFIGKTDAEAETPILWPPDAESWLTGKDPDAGKDRRQEEKGVTEDEKVRWHHWLNGHVKWKLLSCVWLCDSMDSTCQASLSFTISWSFFKFMSIEWCHPTISPSAAFFFCPQSFPVSGSFLVSWLFALGGQSIGASASVLPMNIQGWFPLGLTGWFSLQSKDLNSLLQHHSSKVSILWLSFLYGPTLTSMYDYWKNHSFGWIFVGKVMPLIF